MTYVGRVVLDCNIILQAILNTQGASGACIQCIQEGAGDLVYSDAIVEEYRDVLSRPQLMRKFPVLKPNAIEAFLDDLKKLGRRIDPVPHVVSLPRDTADEPYLDLAIAATASYLVTRDNDLLDFARLTVPDDLARLLAGIEIVDPVEFLKRCRT